MDIKDSGIVLRDNGDGTTSLMFNCAELGLPPHLTADPQPFQIPAPSQVDPIVEAVRADLLHRSQIGIEKYGVTLARKDLNLRNWLQHAYEETLDQANYLKRAIIEIDETKPAEPPKDLRVHDLIENAKTLGYEGEALASWVIGELMLDDPWMRLDAATHRYQQAIGGR